MSPECVEAVSTLRRMARGHPGASSGERAAWEIMKNLSGPIAGYSGAARRGSAQPSSISKMRTRHRNIDPIITHISLGRTHADLSPGYVQ